jgi:hypothetical protein
VHQKDFSQQARGVRTALLLLSLPHRLESLGDNPNLGFISMSVVSVNRKAWLFQWQFMGAHLCLSLTGLARFCAPATFRSAPHRSTFS